MNTNTHTTGSAATLPARRGRRLMAATAIAAALGCSAVGIDTMLAPTVSASSSSAAKADDIVVNTGKITRAERVSGNANNRTVARFAGAQWVFRTNGTFVFAPANARTDLFPLAGTYRRLSSNRFELVASATSRIGYTGTASTALQCVLTVGSTSKIACYWATSMGNAAVVNDIEFANSSVSTLYVEATIG